MRACLKTEEHRLLWSKCHTACIEVNITSVCDAAKEKGEERLKVTWTLQTHGTKPWDGMKSRLKKNFIEVPIGNTL